jgi:hypothetical protein
MNRCNYVFPNQTKNHNKNEVCNCVIRKKNNNGKCWKHISDKNNADNNIALFTPCALPDSEKSNDCQNESDFIQLENS